MAAGFVGVLPDSTGKKIQTFENLVNAVLVESQGVVLVDPATSNGIAVLTAAPAGAEYGLVARVIPHATLPQLVSQGAGAAIANAWPTKLTDGTNLVGIFQFHNADNQVLGGSAYALNTGGISQTLSPAGTADRVRGSAFDNVPQAGIPAGSQQLYMPFAPIPTIPAVVAAGLQAVTPSAMSGTSNGVAWAIQKGHYLTIDTVASGKQEIVFVTAVTATTFTATFAQTHGAATPVVGGVFNVARDAAGVIEGAAPAGVSPSLTMLWNGLLNGGAGGLEYDRSASGELDGASGKGTAVAAEYEFNGGGPGGAFFDRARNLAGKGRFSTTVNGAVAAGVSSIVFASVTSLQPGVPVYFDLGAGTFEVLYVSVTYVPGTLTVTFTTVSTQAHANGGAVSWDAYAGNGPGLNGFFATGLGIEEEALWDPVSSLYYVERAATQDAMPAQNIVAESGVLWNGTNFDRMREATADALAITGIAAESPNLWNGASFDRQRGNVDTGALVTLTAAAAGGNSADQVNFNGRGLQLFINVTAISGTTPSLTVTIQGKDTASGAYYTILAGVAITAVGVQRLTVYPGLTNTVNAMQSDLLPRTFRILYVIAGTTPAVTATIGASVIV
jgi:hypothetical protein